MIGTNDGQKVFKGGVARLGDTYGDLSSESTV